MNNKGFTLIEVLITITIVALIFGIVIKYAGSTLSISKNEAYKIMKNNLVSSGYDYLNECNLGLIKCNLDWIDNRVVFPVVELKNAGYFDDLKSPIDNKDLGTCMNLVATRNNGGVTIELMDECY